MFELISSNKIPNWNSFQNVCMLIVQTENACGLHGSIEKLITAELHHPDQSSQKIVIELSEMSIKFYLFVIYSRISRKTKIENYQWLLLLYSEWMIL